MHYSIGVHGIEVIVWERQLLGIGDSQMWIETGRFAALASPFERCSRQIDAGGLGPCFEPLKVISAQPDPDFQHLQTPGTGETGEVRNERFQFVSGARVRLELLWATKVAAAAGLCVPKILDRFFGDGA